MTVPADHIVDEFRAVLDHNAVLTGGDADPFLLDPRNLRTADVAVVVRPADTAGVAATCGSAPPTMWRSSPRVATPACRTAPNPRPIAHRSCCHSPASTRSSPSTLIAGQSRLRPVSPSRPSRTPRRRSTGCSPPTGVPRHGVGRRRHRNRCRRQQCRSLRQHARQRHGDRSGARRRHDLGRTPRPREGLLGYDLKHLFIGGEGTLGIVTSAVLKLRPATPYETSLLAAITGLDALAPLLDLRSSTPPAR